MKALTGFWPYRKDLLPVAELSGPGRRPEWGGFS